MSFATLANKLSVTMSQMSIFHWLILAIAMWSLLFMGYDRLLKLLLRKMGVDIRYVMPFIINVWQFSFVIISEIMIFACLEVKLSTNWQNQLDSELTKCKVQEYFNAPGLKTIFVLYTSFGLHEIGNVWLNQGHKNLEFLQKQILLATVILTGYARCPRFGLSLLFILHWFNAGKYMAKLCFLVARITNSDTLMKISKFFYGVSLVLWTYIYLYVYPVFLTNNKSVNSAMMKAEINMLIVLDFLSWMYLIISIIISMFSRLITSYLLRSEKRPQTIDYFLFGCDPLLLSFTLSFRPTFYEEERISIVRGHNTRGLRSSVMCIVMLQRKAREIRARRSSVASRRSDVESTTRKESHPREESQMRAEKKSV